jgi:hypothetical protein
MMMLISVLKGVFCMSRNNIQRYSDVLQMMIEYDPKRGVLYTQDGETYPQKLLDTMKNMTPTQKRNIHKLKSVFKIEVYNG